MPATKKKNHELSFETVLEKTIHAESKDKAFESEGSKDEKPMHKAKEHKVLKASVASSAKKNNSNKADKTNKISSIIDNMPKGKIIMKISPEHYFILCDTRAIHDYRELAQMLNDMDEGIFNYHVNDSKNDFANWIHDVFNENEFASKIAACRNKHQMRAEIYKHLLELTEEFLKE